MNIIYPKIYTNRTYSNHKCLSTLVIIYTLYTSDGSLANGYLDDIIMILG